MNDRFLNWQTLNSVGHTAHFLTHTLFPPGWITHKWKWYTLEINRRGKNKQTNTQVQQLQLPELSCSRVAATGHYWLVPIAVLAPNTWERQSQRLLVVIVTASMSVNVHKARTMTTTTQRTLFFAGRPARESVQRSSPESCQSRKEKPETNCD